MHCAKEIKSSKREFDDRKRVPNEGKGRYKRGRVVGDGIVIGDDPGVGCL